MDQNDVTFVDTTELTDNNSVENPAYLADSYLITSNIIELAGMEMPAILFEFSNSLSPEVQNIMLVGSNESFDLFKSHVRQAVDKCALEMSKRESQ